MIQYLRRTDREQRKLLFSLGTNFLTRIPGLIGLLWFLPLLHSGLGTSDYATLLSAMALGSAVAFVAGGTNLMGRRLVGEAYSKHDELAEADGFVSTVIANFASLTVTLAVIGLYVLMRQSGFEFFTVASLVAVSLFLTMFDNVRAAYNEHYVTAILLIIFQTIIYVIGFSVAETREDIITGALILQGSYILASVMTLILLVYHKPYLLRGRAIDTWMVLRQGVMLAIADGFMMMTLSVSVVWLRNVATPEIAAWFATLVRLFQTFLVPIILVLTPLSSYIRLLWNSKSAQKQQMFTRITLVMGCIYGVLVAFSLLIVSHLYISRLLHLPVPVGEWSIFLLFGAIVAYRSYSAIVYVVHDEAVHLSSWTTIAVGLGVLVGAGTSLNVEPLHAINVYALVAGCLITFVLCWNALRFQMNGTAD